MAIQCNHGNSKADLSGNSGVPLPLLAVAMGGAHLHISSLSTAVHTLVSLPPDLSTMVNTMLQAGKEKKGKRNTSVYI